MNEVINIRKYQRKDFFSLSLKATPLEVSRVFSFFASSSEAKRALVDGYDNFTCDSTIQAGAKAHWNFTAEILSDWSISFVSEIFTYLGNSGIEFSLWLENEDEPWRISARSHNGKYNVEFCPDQYYWEDEEEEAPEDIYRDLDLNEVSPLLFSLLGSN
jgi:hypothetical protein